MPNELLGQDAWRPVTEFTARMLFESLRAHASSVENEIRWLDEKDAGSRGDPYIRAVIALLDDALRSADEGRV